MKNIYKYISIILIPLFLISICSCKILTGPSNEIKEVENEDILIKTRVNSGEDHLIEEDNIVLEIKEDSLIEDDILTIAEVKNEVAENNGVVYSPNVYEIELENNNYFKRPIKLTLKYDEDFILEGVSEEALFVAFEDSSGDIYYQGGDIDTVKNTITIDAYHFSRYWTGYEAGFVAFVSGVSILEVEYEDYSRKSLNQTYEILKDNFDYDPKVYPYLIPKDFTSIRDIKATIKWYKDEIESAVFDVVSRMDEFSDKAPKDSIEWKKWASDILWGEKGEAFYIFIGEQTLRLIGMTTAATVWSVGGIMLAFYSAGRIGWNMGLAAREVTEIYDDIQYIEELSNELVKAKKILLMMKDPEIITEYLEELESRGFTITEDMLTNIEKTKTYYEMVDEDSEIDYPFEDFLVDYNEGNIGDISEQQEVLESYEIGDLGPAGGIIFYVNPNFETDGWQYLEAAPYNQSNDLEWFNGSYIVTGATGTGIGTGEENTKKIVEAQGEGNYAAKVCYDLELGGYTDWFLPSKDELNLIYKNLYKKGIGDLHYSDSVDIYWSSSECNEMDAWYQSFVLEGLQECYFKDFAGFADDQHVRAIRLFQ